MSGRYGLTEDDLTRIFKYHEKEVDRLRADNDRLQRRVAELEGLLDRVAMPECMAADEPGLVWCGWCGAEGADVRALDHTRHCAWVAARAALEQGK